MSSDDVFGDDKTPILLHPAKRIELLTKGQELFNEEMFYEAHEAWEQLWLVEQGRDKIYVQGLIQVAAHLVHLQKGNWSGARSVAQHANEKLRNLPLNRLYRELDLTPLLSAMDYNLSLLPRSTGNTLTRVVPPPPPDAFLFPKLFGR